MMFVRSTFWGGPGQVRIAPIMDDALREAPAAADLHEGVVSVPRDLDGLGTRRLGPFGDQPVGGDADAAAGLGEALGADVVHAAAEAVGVDEFGDVAADRLVAGVAI